jgi:HD-like signal output (HDOD) protein
MLWNTAEAIYPVSDPALSNDDGTAGAVVLDEVRRHLASSIETRALQLPLLPGVAAEVIAGSLDDNVDPTRLAQLIQTDQGLASHVLRVVNSPALRAAMEIVALRQAISRLGMNKIREIAIAASLSSALIEPVYRSESQRAWKHALCTGLWAKEIARACRKNTEMAYLCGLLHNIGTPVILRALVGLTKSQLPQRDVMGLLAEFGSTAGELLAREWRLPEVVVATIKWLDRFSDSGTHADAVAVASCAVRFAQLTLTDELTRESVGALDSIGHLNLYPDDVAALLGLRDSISAATESMAP